mmetsp:Transcript_112122/g.328017  ORF Transcript_112122/g.328017 Transcript_112122/m.328017 type:complete len:107 (+) Transcript_112122:1414-1734(+)
MQLQAAWEVLVLGTTRSPGWSIFVVKGHRLASAFQVGDAFGTDCRQGSIFKQSQNCYVLAFHENGFGGSVAMNMLTGNSALEATSLLASVRRMSVHWDLRQQTEDL